MSKHANYDKLVNLDQVFLNPMPKFLFLLPLYTHKRSQLDMMYFSSPSLHKGKIFYSFQENQVQVSSAEKQAALK